MIATVLESAGATVLEAGSPSEAHDRLTDAGPERNVDALVLDWYLRDGSGQRLFDELASLAPDLPSRTVIVTGALLPARGRHPAEQLGVPVLCKPFRPAELLAMITRLVS